MARERLFWGLKTMTIYNEDDVSRARAHVASVGKNPYAAALALNVNPYHIDRLVRHGKITPTLGRSLAKAGVIEEKTLVQVEACRHCGKAHLAKGCPSNRKIDSRRRATVNLDKPENIVKVLRDRMTPEAYRELEAIIVFSRIVESLERISDDVWKGIPQGGKQ